jgi:hypothetical protein
MVERGTLQRLARGIESMAIQALRKPCRIVWVEKGESAPAAVARFLKEHPGAEDAYENPPGELAHRRRRGTSPARRPDD